MHQQSRRQLQERLTSATVPEALAHAVRFFSRGSGIYSAFLEKRSASHVALRGQGGEEIVMAARETPDGTMVSGSSYLFDQQIAACLAALPPARPVVAAAADAAAALPAAEPVV